MGDALVQRAVAILRRLPGEGARALADELAAEWRRTPWLVGITGDLELRTRCLDALCGGGVLGLEDRVPGCATLRLRRGAVPRLLATRQDGTREVHALVPRTDTSGAIEVAPSAIVEELRDELTARTVEAERAERALPRSVRERPPVWAFWLWIVRWIALLFARDKVATRQRAVTARELARERLETSAPAVAAAPPPPADDRAAFLARARTLASGMLAGRGVRELVLELDRALLPDDVEVVELAGPRAPAVDLTVRMTDDVIWLVGDREAALGAADDAAAAFGALAAHARACRLSRRGRAHVLDDLAAIENRIEQAELDFRARVDRLERMRLRDPEAFLAGLAARARPQIISSINTVIEHASTHLGSELAELSATWQRAVGDAGSSDELKAVALAIDREGQVALARIADEVRTLLTGGIGGSVHDIYAGVAIELADHGLPAEELRTPSDVTIPTLDRLRTLTAIKARGIADEIGGAARWFTGLFRSIKARRAELGELIRRHAADLEERAMDDLLEAEPALHAALATALRSALEHAVERQRAWLDRALEDELAAILAERQRLAPLAALVEDVRRDVHELGAQLAPLERAPPPLPASRPASRTG